MTKEEFLTMLNSELENLENEYNMAMSQSIYFRQINPQSKESQQAEYQLGLIRQKIDRVKRLIKLPAYARIQAMSDIEVEEYKKEKIEDLELQIIEIKAREEQAKAKLSQLKKEQESLITKFGTLTGQERENAIHRGKQIQEEIDRYETSEQRGVFTSLKNEIEEVRRQQEEIRRKTSQEIKNDLCSDMKENKTLASAIENTSNAYIDLSKEMLAVVGSDPQKAQEMAGLLTFYRRLSDEQSKIRIRMHLPTIFLPKALEKQITGYGFYYDSSRSEIVEPDRLIEMVAAFEKTFKQSKNDFMSNFTEETLLKLVGKENGVNSSKVDMRFLQQHRDKIGDGELEELQAIVVKRDKLAKKMFKTKDMKRVLEFWNDQIQQKQSKIYMEIIGWFQSQSKSILGLSGEILFYNAETMKRCLDMAKQDILRSEHSIATLKENLQKAKMEKDTQIKHYETKKEEVAKQIRSLGGSKHAETDIPFSSERLEYNLDVVRNAAVNAYEQEIINRVQQQAKHQADIREAELRGISVEELLKIREQESSYGRSR